MRNRVDIGRVLKKAIRPRDDRPIWDWAGDNLILPSSIAKSGRFDVGTSAYFYEPLKALQDNRVRRVSIRWPVRHGKTLLCDVWIPWTIANDPGPFLSCWQTDEMAKSHCESRLIPILRQCGLITDLLSEDRHKTKTQTIILDSGVSVWVRSGGTLATLQSRSVRYLAIDEGWTWENQTNIIEAEGRIGDWEDLGLSKVLYMSQGSVKGDIVDTDWESGTQERWHFDCAKCGRPIPAKLWDVRKDGSRWGLVWDKKVDSHGQVMIGETAETIRYECPHCSHPHLESEGHRARWSSQGRYIRENFSGLDSHRSFTLSCIMGRSWPLIMQEWITATANAKAGRIDQLSIFVQKRMAEAWDSDYLSDTIRLSSGDYEPSDEWPDEVCRWMTVDVQANGLFYYVVRAWSRDGESRRIDFGYTYGWPSLDALQEKWKVQSKRVWVDYGYDSANVARECAARGWVLCKGDQHEHFWHEIKNGKAVKRVARSYAPAKAVDAYIGTKGQGKKGACILVVFSDEKMSDLLHSHLNDARDIFKRPAIQDQEKEKMYRRHMASMRKVLQESKAKLSPDQRKATAIQKQRWLWVAIHKDNHLWDCEKMQILAATVAKIVADPVEAMTADA